MTTKATDIKIIEADDARVGLTVMLNQRTFKRLLKLCGGRETPEGWSAAIAKLIDKAGP